MSTQKERLSEYLASKDPLYAVNKLMTERAMAEAIMRLEQLKGEDGKDGDEGIPGKNGIDGKDGTNGTDGRDGQNGKNGVNGRDGRDGKDGKNGRDGTNGISPTIEAIISELRALPVKYEEIEGAPKYEDLKKLVEYLKAGGFRGGGDTVAAGTNVTITNVNGVKTINAQGGASGFTILQPTETPNGSVTVFTFSLTSAQPSFVVSDNVWLQATTKSGTINWTWNNGTKKATMTIPPADDIYAIV